MKRLILVFMLFIALFAAAAVQAQDATAVGYNEPVTGELTGDTFEVSYTFTAKEGDVVIINVEPVDSLGDLNDTILIVTDPEGNVVADTTEAFSYGKSLVALELVAGGDYTATVTRADGEAGESVGEFTFEVIAPEMLTLDEALTGSIDSDSRAAYYYVRLDQEFAVGYEKTAGDFYPAVTVSVLNSDNFGLSEVGSVYGGELELAALGSFDAETLYIVSLAEALFDFNFDTVTADYNLSVFTSE